MDMCSKTGVAEFPSSGPLFFSCCQVAWGIHIEIDLQNGVFRHRIIILHHPQGLAHAIGGIDMWNPHVSEGSDVTEVKGHS